MYPSSSLLLLAKTITHPAARSLCDSWAPCLICGLTEDNRLLPWYILSVIVTRYASVRHSRKLAILSSSPSSIRHQVVHLWHDIAVSTSWRHLEVNRPALVSTSSWGIVFHCVFISAWLCIVLIDVLIYSAAPLQECFNKLTCLLTYLLTYLLRLCCWSSSSVVRSQVRLGRPRGSCLFDVRSESTWVVLWLPGNLLDWHDVGLLDVSLSRECFFF